MPAIHDWTPVLFTNITDNNSDKIVSVPASEAWQPLSIFVKLVSTAAVGNRQLCVEYQDDTAETGVVIAEVRAGAVQAASLTRYYLFAIGVQDLTAFRDTDLLATPLPPVILMPGYRVRVYDKAAVAATADDMTIQMVYDYRSI